MRNSIFFLFIITIFSLASCRKDFDFEPSTGSLEFSKDVVYLDTVFTNIGSSTYRLKVYNRSNKDINIPIIQLGNGLNSKYRLMIDGIQGNQGKIFNNVELLAKDSLFIFIETTIDYEEFTNPEAQYLYTDVIQFDTGNNLQTVELVTLVKDAIFLYPNRDEEGVYEEIPTGVDENGNPITVRGFFLEEEELTWTSEKPYVIYGYAGVPPSEVLTVEAGARIHFHANSGIIAYNQSSIKINGSQSLTEELENEVIFEGDRLEPAFSDTPGQWGVIWLTNGSTGHEFTNLTIKNATIGILVSGNTGTGNAIADLRLKNVQIYNSSNAGILAQTGYIDGENVVINWAGSSSLYCNYGGKYNFRHCTFNNNWSGTTRFAVRIDNFIEGAIPETQPLDEANFLNCIIFSSNQSALLLSRNQNASFNYLFTRCQIRLSTNLNISTNPLYDFINDTSNIIRNGNPKFLNINNNKLQIDFSSDATGFGTDTGGFDILGNSRNNPSDLGAYNWMLFNE